MLFDATKVVTPREAVQHYLVGLTLQLDYLDQQARLAQESADKAQEDANKYRVRATAARETAAQLTAWLEANKE